MAYLHGFILQDDTFTTTRSFLERAHEAAGGNIQIFCKELFCKNKKEKTNAKKYLRMSDEDFENMGTIEEAAKFFKNIRDMKAVLFLVTARQSLIANQTIDWKSAETYDEQEMVKAKTKSRNLDFHTYLVLIAKHYIFILDPNFKREDFVFTGGNIPRINEAMPFFRKKFSQLMSELNLNPSYSTEKRRLFYGGGGNDENGICSIICSFYIKIIIQINWSQYILSPPAEVFDFIEVTF
ncbi:hypothetical protein PVAND_009539 [Polypedilum vanderplanki]|uniref:Uncharacterized protein n=1 Tax=Polypedilum vanderplanki TaxID=319348 RepID=A0A9J6CEF5_POLVA|nr:hypothetical protein PVAND_009539 [Polypedilum vanderplanki]